MVGERKEIVRGPLYMTFEDGSQWTHEIEFTYVDDIRPFEVTNTDGTIYKGTINFGHVKMSRPRLVLA